MFVGVSTFVGVCWDIYLMFITLYCSLFVVVEWCLLMFIGACYLCLLLVFGACYFLFRWCLLIFVGAC